MSLSRTLRYVGVIFVAILVAVITTSNASAQASCPPRNCTYGKDVDREFFRQVVDRLKDVPASDFAVDALVTWKPYEGTRACWNPLATTWKMSPVCNFNSVGVQQYQDQATGVRATANTLNLSYYNAIRRMLRMEAFDREGMRSALGTWGTCSGSGCNSLLDQWQGLWNRYKGSGSGSGSSTGPAGYTRCADEGERCNFGGTKDVAYGANGRFAFRNGVSGGIDCNNNVFGDPIPGTRKACYIRDAANSGGGSGGGSNCDGGEGVYLYEHSNYQGRCTKLTSDASHPRDWYVGNDAVSSLRTVGGWATSLCEHDNYQGVCSTFYGSDADLSNDGIGHDRASSARVWRTGGGSSGNCDGGEGVYLYEHSNYQGRCTKLTGDASHPRDWAVGNDSVSSIRIVGAWTATLYEHDDYQGASSRFTGDDANLTDNAVGNDRVSSARVSRR